MAKNKDVEPVVEDAGIEETPTIEDVESQNEFEEEELSEVEQVIAAVEVVKEATAKVLGADAERFFLPIKAALEFKKKQVDVSEEIANEEAQKQLKAREAEITAMQEEAARKLDELFGGKSKK